MAQIEHDVLQGVGGGPLALGVPRVVVGVDEVDQRRDRRRVRGVVHVRLGAVVEWDRLGARRLDRFDVGRVVAGSTADERVLADVHRRQELLGRGPAHRTGQRRHDHIGQAEPVEQLDVRRAVGVVRSLEALVVDVEAVRVLHHELAPAQQPGARARLVTELRLDLEERQREVLVGRVEVLDEQREHFLVRRSEEEVCTPTIVEAEQRVAVLGPATARLVRLARQERGDVHLLESGGGHLLAYDALEVLEHDPPEGEPREAARCGAADVAGPDEQPVARHLGVGRVVAEGSQEQRRHPEHSGTLTVPTRSAPLVAA